MVFQCWANVVDGWSNIETTLVQCLVFIGAQRSPIVLYVYLMLYAVDACIYISHIPHELYTSTPTYKPFNAGLLAYPWWRRTVNQLTWGCVSDNE